MISNSNYKFDWNVIEKYWPEILKGLIITIQISLAGMAFSILLGICLANGKLSNNLLIVRISSSITELFRSIPLFVLLFWIYYGFSLKFNFALTEFEAGVLALGITGGAYMAEVFRAGLLAVPIGQLEAAYSIGLSKMQSSMFIIFPQAIRIIIPPMVNIYIGLLKGATIVSVIGVSDMIYVARYVSLETFAPFELYSLVGIIFISLTLSISGFVYLLERKLGRSKVDG